MKIYFFLILHIHNGLTGGSVHHRESGTLADELASKVTNYCLRQKENSEESEPKIK